LIHALNLAPETRKPVCDHIKIRVERILKSKGIDVRLKKAKEELQEAQHEARNNLNNQPVVSTKDRQAGLAIASNKLVVCADDASLLLSRC
jgi:hypothetical protein